MDFNNRDLTSHAGDDTYMHIGKTFRIRESRYSDIPTWYKWFNDPDVTKYIAHGGIPNTAETQELFRNSQLDGANKIIFAVIDKHTPDLIGTCSINIQGHWMHRHSELSMVIGNIAFQKGPLCFELLSWQLQHAFFVLNMHSVYGSVAPENEGLIAAMEKLGFKKIGVRRECLYSEGKYMNAIYFDILKAEWYERNPKLTGNFSKG